MVSVAVSTVVAVVTMFWFDGYVLVGTAIRSETAATADLLHLGIVGIALGSAFGAWTEFVLLRAALRWRIGPVTLGGGVLPVVLTMAIVAAAAGRVAALFVDDPLIGAVPVLGIAGIVYLVGTRMAGLTLRDQLGSP